MTKDQLEASTGITDAAYNEYKEQLAKVFPTDPINLFVAGVDKPGFGITGDRKRIAQALALPQEVRGVPVYLRLEETFGPNERQCLGALVPWLALGQAFSGEANPEFGGEIVCQVMGQYTEIKLPDGQTVQIKTGYDECESYQMGDTIPWVPDFYYPGGDVDGVELTSGYEGFVVIQNSRVVAYMASPEDPDDRDRLQEELQAEYPRSVPPREWWPEIAWERKAELDAAEAKRRAQQEAELAKLSPEDQQIWWHNNACDAINDFTRAKMREDGFFRQLCGRREELPELAAQLTPRLRNEFANWPTSGPQARMLHAAVHYRCQKLLTAAELKGVFIGVKLQPEFAVKCDRLLPRTTNRHGDQI